MVTIVADAMKALLALNASAEKAGAPPRTQLLVVLRASQINGCSVCVDMHSRELKKAGETTNASLRLRLGGIRPILQTRNAQPWPSPGPSRGSGTGRIPLPVKYGGKPPPL